MAGIEEVEAILSDKTRVSKSIEEETKKFDSLQEMLSRETNIFSQLTKQIGLCAEGQTLIHCDAINNKDVIIAMVKCILKENRTPAIILTSMNYKTAQEFLSGAKIDLTKVFLIDPITNNIKREKNNSQVHFIDSLRNLTQLQIKMINIIEEKKPIFIFDSLGVLELYHKEKILLKFIYSLTRLLHKYKTAGYYLLNKDVLVPRLGQFFDDIIKVEKVE